MEQMTMNFNQTNVDMHRISLTKVKLVQWGKFQNDTIPIKDSALITGENTVGKSILLDAILYAYCGHQKFNAAADDKDRSVLTFVRGDTKNIGEDRYLRHGNVISYIILEYYHPLEQKSYVIGVCCESATETDVTSSWFIYDDCTIADLEVCREDILENGKKTLIVYPKLEVKVKDRIARPSDYINSKKAIHQVMRVLNIKGDIRTFRRKLEKLTAIDIEANLSRFIETNMLEAKEITSIADIRKQKEEIEELKKQFHKMNEQKGCLGKVIKAADRYEIGERELLIRQLEYQYQLYQANIAERKELEIQLRSVKSQKKVLESKIANIVTKQTEAEERLREVLNNKEYEKIQNLTKSLEKQIADLNAKITNLKQSVAKLMRLRIQFEEAFDLDEFSTYNIKEKSILESFDSTDFNLADKTQAFINVATFINSQKRKLEEERVHLQDSKRANQENMEIIVKKIKLLESNQMSYPKEIEFARKTIQKEFEIQGIHTDVRLFAELVKEVKDESWRAAIETFLGWKRYYIVVNEKYCMKAAHVLKEKKLYGAHVIITSKLPSSEITKGSAAEILDIPNINARKYANFLLNGIHLCDDEAELENYPKGSLTKDGMLAKSYAINQMNLSKTDMCFGAEAIKLQLENANSQLRTLDKESTVLEKRICQCNNKLNLLNKINLDEESYQFSAPHDLVEHKKRLEQSTKELNELKNSSGFTAFFKEKENAESALEKIKKERDDANEKNGDYLRSIKYYEEKIKKNENDAPVLEKNWNQSILEHLELKNAVITDYKKKSKNGTKLMVISEATLNNHKKSVDEIKKVLETEQYAFCRLKGWDMIETGPAFINKYRMEYKSLQNIKIEELLNKLDVRGEDLKTSFMNEFIGKLNEQMEEAKREIHILNKELRNKHFGNDTYEFIMKDAEDRKAFFRISDRLNRAYMDSPDAYYSSSNTELEEDINDYINMVLEQEDTSLFTDYRKYFRYDIKIISRKGNEIVSSFLSQKQDSASNGEKHTPYFVLLAVNMLQCYPEKECCARNIFIDEAFSVLDPRRIEELIKFFEENHFQVIYAAPQGKLSDIGKYINTVIGLVPNGKYTKSIEGIEVK